jgi:hypothetical protein
MTSKDIFKRAGSGVQAATSGSEVRTSAASALRAWALRQCASNCFVRLTLAFSAPGKNSRFGQAEQCAVTVLKTNVGFEVAAFRTSMSIKKPFVCGNSGCSGPQLELLRGVALIRVGQPREECWSELTSDRQERWSSKGARCFELCFYCTATVTSFESSAREKFRFGRLNRFPLCVPARLTSATKMMDTRRKVPASRAVAHTTIVLLHSAAKS